jgi:hypothetical protein
MLFLRITRLALPAYGQSGRRDIRCDAGPSSPDTVVLDSSNNGAECTDIGTDGTPVASGGPRLRRTSRRTSVRSEQDSIAGHSEATRRAASTRKQKSSTSPELDLVPTLLTTLKDDDQGAQVSSRQRRAAARASLCMHASPDPPLQRKGERPRTGGSRMHASTDPAPRRNGERLRSKSTGMHASANSAPLRNGERVRSKSTGMHASADQAPLRSGERPRSRSSRMRSSLNPAPPRNGVLVRGSAATLARSSTLPRELIRLLDNAALRPAKRLRYKSSGATASAGRTERNRSPPLLRASCSSATVLPSPQPQRRQTRSACPEVKSRDGPAAEEAAEARASRLCRRESQRAARTPDAPQHPCENKSHRVAKTVDVSSDSDSDFVNGPAVVRRRPAARIATQVSRGLPLGAAGFVEWW